MEKSTVANIDCFFVVQIISVLVGSVNKKEKAPKVAGTFSARFKGFDKFNEIASRNLLI